MKINFRVRAKKPYFWIGLLGVIMTATGIELYTLTSWDALCEQVKALYILKKSLKEYIIKIY